MKLCAMELRAAKSHGIIDRDGGIRDLSGHVGDISGAVLSRAGLGLPPRSIRPPCRLSMPASVSALRGQAGQLHSRSVSTTQRSCGRIEHAGFRPRADPVQQGAVLDRRSDDDLVLPADALKTDWGGTGGCDGRGRLAVDRASASTLSPAPASATTSPNAAGSGRRGGQWMKARADPASVRSGRG